MPPAPPAPPAALDRLLRTIADRSAVVGVIGLGYVGLPLAGVFRRAGFRVMGFDIDPAKIEMLRAGRSYIRHLGDEFVARLGPGAEFEPTCDFHRLGEPDAVLICVPTPLDAAQQPDLSFVHRTAEDVGATLRAGQLVVLESTTYPGTTRDDVLPRLLAPSPSGRGPGRGAALSLGSDFFLAFSPEREDPGRKDLSTHQIPKLVGGVDGPSGRAAAALYSAAFEKIVPCSSAEVAEAAKLLENIYRAVNIALVNEMKVILGAMGIDVWEVIAAASTKPFGFQRFDPGPGLGGHCIPIDPFYLSWKARRVGQPTRFIELAGEINHAMPDYVVGRTVSALAERGTPISAARVLILGLAYKPDIDDVRESPSLELIEKFDALGARVDYNDPHVPRTHRMRRHDWKMESVPLSPEMLRGYDAVVISTHHSAYDWAMIAAHARLVVDTRNALRVVGGANIVRA